MSLLMGVLIMAASANLNDSLDTFPIGFWNYASVSVFDEAKVQEWQDAGMTLTMGPGYEATPESIAHMKQVLDWSEKRNIKVIVCDPRLHGTSSNSQGYADRVKQAVEDLGKHRSAFGFHILDEPAKEDFQAVCDAVRINRTVAPDLHPFVNHLPWFPGAEKRVGFDTWQAYLEAFITKSGAEFLSYDCYMQMNPGKSGWAQYFRNLSEYREAAKRHGIPFWNTILSVGHFHYRCPSEDDVRWQFNTSIAYGAQGILYFFFYMRQPHDNYRLAPIDEFWHRTPIFDSLARVNKGFVKRYGRLFLELDLQKAMQWPESLPGCQAFEPDDLISSVSADGKRWLIVSRFLDKQGRPWIALVNNSVRESTLATITLKGAETKAFALNWENEETSVGVKTVSGGVELEHWLAPGQMEVYRVAQSL
jgi:hypothetical protein